MSEETVKLNDEILEEDKEDDLEEDDLEEDEDDEPRDWGKIGIAALFFLIVVIGYYIIQAI